MYYVYLLKSKKNGDVYVGYTDNLKRRLDEHNQGKSMYTKSYKPWILVFYEAYRSKKDTTKREKELKIHAAKIKLREQMKHSLEL